MDCYDDSTDSLSDFDDDDDVEDDSDYRYGGYHHVQIGEVFNKKYIVKNKLGWGHFSTVWLVSSVDPSIPIEGALKVVRSAEEYTETAKDEIEILRKITDCDPKREFFCLHLIDSFTHRGLNGIHTCLVTDCGGSNLLSLIKLFHYRGIPMEITKEISRQVLVALDYLHTKCQLIHTDLKPENVLLNFCIGTDVKRRNQVPHFKDIKIILADFGNANWVNKRFTNDIQTRQYRCPEVMLRLHWDCPSDIWSHACMMFELLTGDFLFAPKQSTHFTKEEDHFAQFIELLGPLPNEMINSSPIRNRFFNSNFELKKIPNKQLSFWPIESVLKEKYKIDPENAFIIASLLESMLVYDENKRATARECLNHRWFL
ncbi:non-specific serine/threonine protein kinase [Entamoeba marina]